MNAPKNPPSATQAADVRVTRLLDRIAHNYARLDDELTELEAMLPASEHEAPSVKSRPNSQRPRKPR